MTNPDGQADGKWHSGVAALSKRHTQQKRIAVTGGAGFLGSHLCEELLKLGHSVVCVDDFSTGRIDNINHLIQAPRFSLQTHDIRQDFDLDIDAIFNFASPASPPAYQADPIGTTKTNVFGTLNCLDIAMRHGATIVQASTSEVYGDPIISPQQETYFGNVNTIGPRACYDEGKRCAETLIFDYARMHGVNIKVGRIFNTYGPRMRPDDGRVVSNFIVQALTNQDLTIYGSGAQTRSFCYVDDLIAGFLKLFASPVEVTGPINIGNPSEFTVLELAEKVIRLTNSRSRIIHLAAAIDDPQQRRPDITRAATELDWQPTTSVDDGLRRAIEYFDRELVRDILVAEAVH
jgi:UDP-glucuronate decarboxylase